MNESSGRRMNNENKIRNKLLYDSNQHQEVNQQTSLVQAQLSSSERTFFEHKDEALDLIQIISTSSKNSQRCSRNRALQKFRTLMDGYLECPTVLDEHLECMVSILSNQAQILIQKQFNTIRSVSDDEEEEKNNLQHINYNVRTNTVDAENNDCLNRNKIVDDNDRDDDNNNAAIHNHFNNNKQHPHETNPVNNDHGSIDNNDKQHCLKCCLSSLYVMSKVCGRKKIQRFLPHNPFDVEPVLHCLMEQSSTTVVPPSSSNKNNTKMQSFDDDDDDEQQQQQPPKWESTYVLLLWMQVLSLVPFDLTTIDSSSTSIANLTMQRNNHEPSTTTTTTTTTSSSSTIASATDTSSCSKKTLVELIIQTCYKYLSNSGPCRDASCYCLASFLIRYDLSFNELSNFIKHSKITLEEEIYMKHKKKCSTTTTTTGRSITEQMFHIMSLLQTLCIIFKLSPNRCILLEYVISENKEVGLWKLLLYISSTKHLWNTNVIIRKLIMKLFSRIGCALLSPNVPSEWKYQRGSNSGGGAGGGGRRSLMDNLRQTNVSNKDKDTTGTSIAQEQQQQQQHTSKKSKNDEEDITINDEQPQTQENHDNDNNDNNSEIGFWIINDHILNIIEDIIDQLLLKGLYDSATIVRWSSAKGIGRITERLPKLCADDIVNTIIQPLCDTTTTTTTTTTSVHHTSGSNNSNVWHGSCLVLGELARKGLLLPNQLTNIIIPQIVQRAMFYETRANGGQQQYVGNHVRDAACYICWSIARSYDSNILLLNTSTTTTKLLSSSLSLSKSSIYSLQDQNKDVFLFNNEQDEDLCVTMVVASLFDREINGRRAASAAFQEWVGRMGGQNVKHGIDILTIADFYTLGNRYDSYIKISPIIVSYDIQYYGIPIIKHLCYNKLIHWDINIRQLSSITLGILTYEIYQLRYYMIHQILPILIKQCTSNDIYKRHGSILGVAEIVLALSYSASKRNNIDGIGSSSNTNNSTQKSNDSNNNVLPNNDDIINIVIQIEKQRLYRGKGGEIIRSAVMRFIECISKSKLTLSVKEQVFYLDTIDNTSLIHPNETIQYAAGKALKALMNTYFPVHITKGPSERLQKRVVDTYVTQILTNSNVAITRGYTLGLGVLPAKLLAPTRDILHKVLHCLKQVSYPCYKVGNDEPDAETRRNAIISLIQICQTVGIQTQQQQQQRDDNNKIFRVGLQRNDIILVLNILLISTEDYGIDRRGDVGSWVRCEAMKGLKDIIILLVNSSSFNKSNEFILCPPTIPSFLNISLSKTLSSSKLPSLDDHSDNTIGQQMIDVVPSMNERSNYLIPNCVVKVHESLIEKRPLFYNKKETSHSNQTQVTSANNSTEVVVLDEHVIILVLSTLFKQLSEKLDSVRIVAGYCIETLLVMAQKQNIPFITQKRYQLLKAFHLFDDCSHPQENSSNNSRSRRSVDQNSINTEQKTHHDSSYYQEQSDSLYHCSSSSSKYNGSSNNLLGTRRTTTYNNYGSPNIAYPIVMNIASAFSTVFFDSIMAGIIISVGGITQTTTNESTKALYNMLLSQQQSHHPQQQQQTTTILNRVTNVFLTLFQRHTKEERVILPTLKTLHKLILLRTSTKTTTGNSSSSKQYLFESEMFIKQVKRGTSSSSSSIKNTTTTFVKELLHYIEIETNGCRSIKRLLAIVDVAVECLGHGTGGDGETKQDINDKDYNNNNNNKDDDDENDARTGTSSNSLLFFHNDDEVSYVSFILESLLCHKFPRVRKYTAEQIYTKLIELEEEYCYDCHNDIVSKKRDIFESCTDILLETKWGADDIISSDYYQNETDTTTGNGRSSMSSYETIVASCYEIAKLFDITIHIEDTSHNQKQHTSNQQHQMKKNDEFSSYMSLVKDAGR